MRKTCLASVLLVSTLCAPGQAGETAPSTSPLQDALISYNGSPLAGTRLALAEAGPEQETSTSAGVLPAWLADVAFTSREAEALVAAVGAFGVDQHLYPGKRKAKFGDYLLALPLYLAADAASEKAGGDDFVLYQPVSNLRDSKVTYAQAPDQGIRGRPRVLTAFPSIAKNWKSPESRFSAILLKLGSCNGAYTSAVRKIQANHPEGEFTRFAGLVRDYLPVVPANGECKPVG